MAIHWGEEDETNEITFFLSSQHTFGALESII